MFVPCGCGGDLLRDSEFNVMPREVYELTPPQLEWLIENQTLTHGEALDESAKMGWGPVENFARQQGYSSHHDNMPYYALQHPHSPPHHHMESYHSSEYHHEDAGNRGPFRDNENYLKNNQNCHSMETDDHHLRDLDDMECDDKHDPYPHRVGKLTWEQSFDNLRIYAEKNGHCNVPRYFSEHPQLGSWVHRQRLKRKSPKKYGYLSPDQVKQLTELGFCWQLRGEGKQNYVNPMKTHTSG